jgi:nucleoside-diphosphate-sugar epimerase
VNYFVTGSNGFIGKHICEKLKTAGHTVVSYDRSRPAQIPVGTEAVIHLAAEIYNESIMFDVNVQLTYELLESAKQLSTLRSFIYVGSSSEYGEKRLPMYEHDVLHPRTMYEATKGCGTLLTESYARNYKMPTAIVRPFTVYGPGEPAHRFIPKLFDATFKKTAVIVAPGVHDFIYIDDFVNGLLNVEQGIQIGRAPLGDIVNIGTGVETSNLELVKAVDFVTGKRIQYTLTNDLLRSYDTLHWKASIRKLKQNYLFEPKITLEEGLGATLHAYYI